jgi:hypothetical protein
VSRQANTGQHDDRVLPWSNYQFIGTRFPLRARPFVIVSHQIPWQHNSYDVWKECWL